MPSTKDDIESTKSMSKKLDKLVKGAEKDLGVAPKRGRPLKATSDDPKPKPKPKKEVDHSKELMKRLDSIESKLVVPEKKPRKKRILNEEQKQTLRDRLVKAREARVLKKGKPKE